MAGAALVLMARLRNRARNGVEHYRPRLEPRLRTEPNPLTEARQEVLAWVAKVSRNPNRVWTMRHIQQAVCVVRRSGRAPAGLLTAAGYREKAR